jgi:hypothetical protein
MQLRVRKRFRSGARDRSGSGVKASPQSILLRADEVIE